MFLHPVSLTALLCPVAVYFLCESFDLLDPLNLSMCEAATLSCSGVLMWLRSRYLASTYLNERQNRKAAFLNSLRRGVDDSSRGSVSFKEGEEQQQQPQGTLRTVARVAPVWPAFIACCFFLLSFYGLMSAVLHVIWFVRSEEAPP